MSKRHRQIWDLRIDTQQRAEAKVQSTIEAYHDLTKMSYNRTAIAGIILAAENYGVRMLEADLVNNQSEGSYEGVMIFRGAIAEILDAIMDRNESALAIQERLHRLRGGKK
jgi:hypothetical protein